MGPRGDTVPSANFCGMLWGMKLLVEILLAIFLHPVVWVLCVINIVGRSELSGLQKVLWIIVTFVWGIGPILYVLLGGGAFW